MAKQDSSNTARRLRAARLFAQYARLVPLSDIPPLRVVTPEWIEGIEQTIRDLGEEPVA